MIYAATIGASFFHFTKIIRERILASGSVFDIIIQRATIGFSMGAAMQTMMEGADISLNWSEFSRPGKSEGAIVPGDDRTHLRLGQTARHDAQNQTSRHNQGHYRFHAQSDRLQPDPHSQIADGLADSAHNHPVAPRARRQRDRKSATLQVLQRTARAS
jgi:hypothetical protein